MNNKLKYFFDSFRHYYSNKNCPSCTCNRVKLVQRKYFVTRLFECQECNLMFRHPKDTMSFNKNFYQDEYKQEGGITTDLPTENELKELISNNFNLTDKNVLNFVKIFDALSLDLKGLKITDFGSSWGYMTYQFLQKRYDVDSFEISKSRAIFGNEKLGLQIKTDENNLLSNRDVFFSSHVIEHVPVVSNMLKLAKKLIKKDGFFIAECPNGSEDFKQKNPKNFKRIWGLVHPNVLSDKFYSKVFKNYPYIILYSPYEANTIHQIRSWNQQDQLILDVSGAQLLVIVKIDDN